MPSLPATSANVALCVGQTRPRERRYRPAMSPSIELRTATHMGITDMPTSLDENLHDALKSVRTRLLFLMRLDVRKPQIVGATPGTFRRVGVITGGLFEGERLSGEVLEGGSDWQTVRSDSATTLNVRIVLKTNDDALIGMTYTGIPLRAPRHPRPNRQRRSVRSHDSLFPHCTRFRDCGSAVQAGSTASSRSASAIAGQKGRSTACSKCSDATRHGRVQECCQTSPAESWVEPASRSVLRHSNSSGSTKHCILLSPSDNIYEWSPGATLRSTISLGSMESRFSQIPRAAMPFALSSDGSRSVRSDRTVRHSLTLHGKGATTGRL